MGGEGEVPFPDEEGERGVGMRERREGGYINVPIGSPVYTVPNCPEPRTSSGNI